MKFTLSVLLCLLFCINLSCQENQKSFNLDFEKNNKVNTLPVNWFQMGPPNKFIFRLDTAEVYSGKYSLLISSSEAFEPNTFGCLAYKIPANYKAKMVTFTGYMKIENVTDGYAAMFLRIDGKNKILEFESLQNQNLHGTFDWTKYAISLPLAEEAKNIYVAGILGGKGKAWFDNFEVFLDGKNIFDVDTVVKSPAEAVKDTEFDSGSNISLNDVTQHQINTLYKVGKVWGFLKYYHPAIAAGNRNWDYDLFRIIMSVINEEDENEINTKLVDIINNLGKLTPRKNTKEISDIKLTPDLDWITDTGFLGKELSNKLVEVKKSERTDENYYVGLSDMVGNPIFKHEDIYNNMKFDDDGMKLLALFRYWNMIEYFFPYRNLIGKDWDKVLKENIPVFIKADEHLSYNLALLELIGSIHDTHANIYPQANSALEKFWGMKNVPFQITFLNEQPVITNIKKEISDKTGLKIGDVITKVNGTPVKKLIDEKIKYCTASNLPTQYRNLSQLILRTNDDSVDLTISREDAKSLNYKINCEPIMTNLYSDKDKPSFKILKGNIGYIYPGTLKPGEIDSIMGLFKDTNGLIIDLRCYPSDFIVFSLTKYLMPHPVDFVKFSKGSLIDPGEFNFKYTLKVGEENKDYYKKKVIILVNERTQSQAEYTSMALRVAPKAVVVGSTTAGADGNVSLISLPGGIQSYISGIGVYYPDGSETQRTGILPDIEIHPTLEGIRKGEDELLNKAIELINKDVNTLP